MDTTEGQVTSSMVEIMKEPICVKATVDSTHVIHVMENSDSVDGSGHACTVNQLPSEVVLNPKQGTWQRKQPHQGRMDTGWVNDCKPVGTKRKGKKTFLASDFGHGKNKNWRWK